MEEIHTLTKEELLSSMQISLASRASEQIFLGMGEEMAGASGDLQHATQTAEAMVKLYGMNGSLMSYGGILGMTGFGGGGGPSREVDRLLDQNFKRVKMLLEENRAGVVAVAEALIEKHALMGDEVYELMAKAEGRTNGHTPESPPPDAPAFEIATGGQILRDPTN
jgi:ATP-dependent Zn protease